MTNATDIVADDMLVAFVDRILRMRDEEDAIKADVREIYAEAKANGFDKTQLGKVVARLRQVAKNASKLDEQEAIFDLYLTAYFRAKRQTGTAVATHTHEAVQ